MRVRFFHKRQRLDEASRFQPILSAPFMKKINLLEMQLRIQVAYVLHVASCTEEIPARKLEAQVFLRLWLSSESKHFRAFMPRAQIEM